MEITDIGFLFWFDIITLILCCLKPAKRAIMLNIFCSLGFIILGIAHIFPIYYIGFGSPANPIPYDTDPVVMFPQKAVAWLYMGFGFAFLVTSILKALTGMEEESWSVFTRQK